MGTFLEAAAISSNQQTPTILELEAPCAGNSPVQLHKDHLRGVVENWYNLSMSLKADPAADKAFGWILDMYAFSIASAQSEEGPIQYEIHRELMAQPPFDPFLTIEAMPSNSPSPWISYRGALCTAYPLGAGM